MNPRTIRLEIELRHFLKQTREEPGLSLHRIALIIKEVFAKEEIEALIFVLKKLLK